MPAVVTQISGVRRLVLEVDPAILLDQRCESGRDGAAEIAELFALDQAVQRDRGRRPGVSLRPRAVARLVVPEDAAGDGGRRGEPGRIAARVPPRDLHVGDRGPGVADVGGGVNPPGAELRREPSGARPQRGDVHGNRVLDVDRPDLGVEEADLAPLALERPFERLPREQAAHDAHVFLHVRELHRPEPHRPTGCEAGGDPEVDPARRQRVQGGQPARRDRRDAIRRNQHAGGETNFRRLHRGGGHRGEELRVEELCVIEPGAAEAQLFGPLHHLPGIRGGCQKNVEVHHGSPGVIGVIVTSGVSACWVRRPSGGARPGSP